ncbi:Mesoderm induction early response protein 1 [Sarcoptes scabiei]|nr:Mesoderm induction early response protein 1 [Sarcoptes scabiei]
MAEPNTNEYGVGSDSDQDFDPSAEMLVNDFDDEHTLDEEEALSDELANKNELDELTKEQNIPIEELLQMYGYNQDKSSSAENSADKTTDAADPSNSNVFNQPQTSSLNQSLNSDYSDEDSDEDFSVNEDEWRRTIQVGSDFQAVIPEGLKQYEDNFIDYGDKFLWKPSASINVNLIDEYLLEYAKSSLSDDENFADFILPSGSHIKDDEQALFTLLNCKYDSKNALYKHENGTETKAPISESMTPWTEEECRAFEAGLRTFGKDFYQIKFRIPTRSVGEVISFYYLWKKTERHDIFANKYRMEKKKYSLHPGTTDYMDRFIDDQENVSMNAQNSLMLPNNAAINTSNTLTNPQMHLSQNNSSSSSNYHHHISLNQSNNSMNTNRQSPSFHHSAQASSSRQTNHLSSETSFRNNNNNVTSMTLCRTINVSNEPQTILINNLDFVSNNDVKPIVVCTSSNSSGRTSHYGNSSTGSSNEMHPNTTTIVANQCLSINYPIHQH